MLPPIPSWDAIHPLIVHFPVALLLVAPLLILLGSFLPERGRPILISAFILMLIGTIGAWVAISTGESAGELAERIPGAEAVLENHEELAQTTAAVFSALTAVFGVIVFAPMIFRKEFSSRIVIPVNMAFLLFFSAGAVLLINTAHQGGRLVHEYGVRAAIAPGAAPALLQQKSGKHKDSDDDD